MRSRVTGINSVPVNLKKTIYSVACMKYWNMCTIFSSVVLHGKERQSDGTFSISVKRHPLLRDVRYLTGADSNT